MPDKQLILTIPELNKDGTCNDQCPLKTCDNEGYICRHKLHRIDHEGMIRPYMACPQWQSKGIWYPISGDDASMCQVCKKITKWNQPRICKCDNAIR
jgi:hypothetical protein